jgi:hypothetical protein
VGFIFRLMFYALLSIPFAVFAMIYGDMVQGVGNSLLVHRMSGTGEFVRIALSLAVFLPWFAGLTAVAFFESSRSRSLIMTGLAAVSFGVASVIMLTGLSVFGLFRGSDAGYLLQRLSLTGPDGLTHLFSRHAHDLFGPYLFSSTHAIALPGFWLLQGLMVPLMLALTILALAVLTGYMIGSSRPRHA